MQRTDDRQDAAAIQREPETWAGAQCFPLSHPPHSAHHPSHSARLNICQPRPLLSLPRLPLWFSAVICLEDGNSLLNWLPAPSNVGFPQPPPRPFLRASLWPFPPLKLFKHEFFLSSPQALLLPPKPKNLHNLTPASFSSLHSEDSLP